MLVGMMGAGKTTVGRLLAQRLRCPYVDSDEEVEQFTGRTVKELFDAGGEAAFRPLETEALHAAVSGSGPVVVAVAGGAVLDPANRDLLRRAGTVVWLRARPSTLARRVVSGTHRPLLEHDPAAVIEELDAVRRPLYEELADVVVDVDDLDPSAVVDRVLEAIA
jgi:shikimate kinase